MPAEPQARDRQRHRDQVDHEERRATAVGVHRRAVAERPVPAQAVADEHAAQVGDDEREDRVLDQPGVAGQVEAVGQEVEDQERGERRQPAGDHEAPDLHQHMRQVRRARHPCSLGRAEGLSASARSDGPPGPPAIRRVVGGGLGGGLGGVVSGRRVRRRGGRPRAAARQSPDHDEHAGPADRRTPPRRHHEHGTHRPRGKVVRSGRVAGGVSHGALDEGGRRRLVRVAECLRSGQDGEHRQDAHRRRRWRRPGSSPRRPPPSRSRSDRGRRPGRRPSGRPRPPCHPGPPRRRPSPHRAPRSRRPPPRRSGWSRSPARRSPAARAAARTPSAPRSRPTTITGRRPIVSATLPVGSRSAPLTRLTTRNAA